MSTTRGRRRGAPDTRAQILEAARDLFGTQGFARTTIRSIATAAQVDPALVHHYFGSKDDLFVAALQLPVDLRAEILPALAGGPEGAAERLLHVLLRVWDDPANQPALLLVARSLLDPGQDRLLPEGFLPVVLIPIGRQLGLDHVEVRIPFVATQMLGLVLSRYVLRVEPIASMDPDVLVAAYAPGIQRYLTGDLPGS